jgi:hypothetical protein
MVTGRTMAILMLAAALRELHIDRRLTGAGPLVPIMGP